MTDEVLFGVAAGVGRVLLNRPRAINALNHDMLSALEAKLLSWRDDPAVLQVELRGAEERGFCAGADVRELREFVLADQESAVSWLRNEYRLDSLLANYPKPVRTHLVGISMGGGLGLALRSTRRIGAAGTRLAMPEVGIGLWPDVGACHELSRCPGELGTHLAVTGATIDGTSALYAGLLDEAVDIAPGSVSELEIDRYWIDECYRLDDPVRIVQSLEGHDNPRARQAGELIRTRSPLSVWVALAAIRRAAVLDTVDQVLAQDLVLAQRFLAVSDFIEGVRARLIDKDRQPHWRHACIEDVDPAEVAALFAAD